MPPEAALSTCSLIEVAALPVAVVGLHVGPRTTQRLYAIAPLAKF
jgi:hypothetical protein